MNSQDFIQKDSANIDSFELYVKSKEFDEFKHIVKEQYDNNYISYAMDKSKFLILNEENNIAKHILIAFIVNAKIKSLFDVIQSEADTGKSYTFEVLLHFFIPDEYVVKMNATTEAAFRNPCIKDHYKYDGLILYFGDLGDIDHYESMKPVFNIIKQVISEGEYHGSKMANNNTDISYYSVLGIVGALYCHVSGSNDENDFNQLASRSIISTPALNNKDEKINFQKNISTKVTHEYNLYKQAIAELKGFEKYYKERVEYYRVHGDNIEVINPFFNLFDKISEHRLTETRELFLLDDLFKAYCILNEDCCFKYGKTIQYGDEVKDIIILLPKIETVQSFINIVYSGVGLKPQERNLILKLKKEFNYISEKEANEKFDKLLEETSSNNYLKSEININDTFKELLSNHDVYSDNSLFFKSSDISKKFRNAKEVKRISSNLSNVLRELEKRNFLKKFEEKNNNANIYYFNENIIKNIEKEYIITNDNIKNALDYIEKTYKLNTSKKDGYQLFTEEEMNVIRKNYKKSNTRID